MNGFTLLALILIGAGVVIAWRAGVMRGRREARVAEPWRPAVIAPPPAAPVVPAAPPPAPVVPPAPPAATPAAPAPTAPVPDDPLAGERFRLALAYEREASSLRQALAREGARAANVQSLDDERRGLQRALAEAREETARYRQILVDLENNAPPPLLDGPGAPDDLKLIVGVGPVLERMLHQLGITTYRQVARWTPRDIDVFDAKLPEFHGRIRRDDWVTQARQLHQSKYGEPPSPPRG